MPGPAQMAVWPKALPLTASCLSPLYGFESHPGLVRELPVTWDWAFVRFRRVPLFPPPVTTG